VSSLVAFLKSIAEAPWFSNFIIGVILFAGVLVGVQTYPSMVETYGTALHFTDQVILWIFVAEIVIKMGAEGAKPWRYFLDPWNVFDFLIVAVCFMPLDAQYVTVLRLARLLRVLKLVNALPELRIIVSALLKSIPSMFYISLLLFILFYLYAVLAVFTFNVNDPVHFDTLQKSMLSLFRVATLEDWTDIMYINMYGCINYGYEGNPVCTPETSHAFGWVAAGFFSSFVLVATMVILNLFIGVIMNGMDEAREEMKAEMKALKGEAVDAGEASHTEALTHRLGDLAEQMTTLQIDLEKWQAEMEKRYGAGGSPPTG
jgi:voltage-gated sodium channel